MIDVGLRVDVDTYRGTRDGVPRLLDLLARHGVTASFFFSLGPDNMGRHLLRLFRPRFLLKMLRSRAGRLYGWDIVFAGTLWPGRRIAAGLGHVIRAADRAGHEIGLHAWDHHRWQTRAGQMTVPALHRELERGVEALAGLIGRVPDCSAAAGWICNERALEAKAELGFAYNSDCRGRSVFRPLVGGRRLAPQVPTTMPTYDELIGKDGIDDDNYNERLLEHAHPGRLNVLTVHAEVEGIACAPLFDDFLASCRQRNIRLLPLRDLPQLRAALAAEPIAQAPLPGRDGAVCWQSSAVAAGACHA